MKISPLVYLNGHILPVKRARVSPLDRGFLYGDGAFESMRAMGGVVLERDAHLARLFASAKRLGIPLERAYSAEKLAHGAAALLRTNKLQDALIRLSVTRGEASWWGLSSKNVKGKPTVCMFAVPFKGYSEKDYEAGAALITSPFRHVPPASLPSGVKSLNYLAGVLAMDDALRRKADEALLLTTAGKISEGTRSNIFWVKRNVVYTPALSTGVLPGITRARAITLARAMGFSVKEIVSPRRVLDGADEIFYTNTSSWAMPVTRLDGRRVGSAKMGPVTRLVLTAFRIHYARKTVDN